MSVLKWLGDNLNPMKEAREEMRAAKEETEQLAEQISQKHLLKLDEETWQHLTALAKRKGLSPQRALAQAIQIDEYLVGLVLDRDYTICVLPREEATHVDELVYNDWLRENAK